MLYDRARLGSCGAQMLNDDINRVRKQSQTLVTDASSQSIVTTMDRFVKAVNEMNTHVILPTMLLDVDESPSDDVPVLLRGGNTRYDFYKCLNVIKNNLVLGVSSSDDYNDDDSLPSSSRTSPQKELPPSSFPQEDLKSPTRRHSTECSPMPQSGENTPTRKISLTMPVTQENIAVTAASIRRQDSWASLDPLLEEQQQPSRRKSGLASINIRPEYHLQINCDSGAECEADVNHVVSPIEMAEQLREHLQGLQIGLHHLTYTAKYITKSIE